MDIHGVDPNYRGQQPAAAADPLLMHAVLSGISDVVACILSIDSGSTGRATFQSNGATLIDS